jgi:DNA-binding beta-propeller fold protein YncE
MFLSSFSHSEGKAMRTATITGAIGVGLFAASLSAVAAPAASPFQIRITPLSTYATGQFDQSAAEIVAHDPKTQRLFVVNAQSGNIDVLDAADPSAPKLLFSVPSGGIVNSVAVHKGLVAAAVEAIPKTDPGHVMFFTAEGQILATVTVGALPDMLTFTPDGKRVLVANEGEPNDDYTIDPEGSVSIIDLPKNIRKLSQAHVRTARFGFDAADLDPGVRIFGPNATVATNLEPEYITVARNGKTAWVALQEANAIAILDVDAGRFKAVRSLGFKDHLLPGNELDVGDQDGGIRIGNWPVLGMYQPDGIASYEYRGKTFLVTTNEGDARDWPGTPGYSEVSRFRALSGSVPPCADSPRLNAFFAENPFGITTLAQLRDNANMGRLNVTKATGLRADGSCYEDIYAFGGRSFSIWSEAVEQVYDSGSDFERITAELNPSYFNSNHTTDSFDNRSDDKGPEPEGIAVAKLFGRVYAFVGLERIGGVMIYDITNPYAPSFVQYYNNREFFPAATTPTLEQRRDLGPESLIVIAPEKSPIPGVPLLVVANEVSGTTTVFRIDREKLVGRRK